MAKSFKLEIITPSKKFFSGDVEHVICKTPIGFEGFMADHTYTVKLLEEGVLRFKLSGSGEKDWKIAHAGNGFIDVKDEVIIYTDFVDWN